MADKKLNTEELKQVSGGAMSEEDYNYALGQIERRIGSCGDRNHAKYYLNQMKAKTNKTYTRAEIDAWLDEECD